MGGWYSSSCWMEGICHGRLVGSFTCMVVVSVEDDLFPKSIFGFSRRIMVGYHITGI